MAASPLDFRVLHQRGRARLGVMRIRGRELATPAFLPVGTAATVKGVFGRELIELGFRGILANTYHLHLRPGEACVEELGGIHRFMDFPGVVITDSGGFQVFSLAKSRRITDEGAIFQSHLDGNTIHLTPESSMAIQQRLDSDIAMVLDECPAIDCPPDELRSAVERSIAWAGRSLAFHRQLGRERAVFGIVQGGRNIELRRSMARQLAGMDFDGYAMGGVSVGEDPAAIRATVAASVDALPPNRPRYLMGVGSPAELVDAVQHGMDLFDCVLPTRTGRTGLLYTRQGMVKIRNQQHARSSAPVEEGCPCLACRRYTRAYLRHLFQAGEMLGPMLATRHNLCFFARLVADVRAWIQGAARDFGFLPLLSTRQAAEGSSAE